MHQHCEDAIAGTSLIPAFLRKLIEMPRLVLITARSTDVLRLFSQSKKDVGLTLSALRCRRRIPGLFLQKRPKRPQQRSAHACRGRLAVLCRRSGHESLHRNAVCLILDSSFHTRMKHRMAFIYSEKGGLSPLSSRKRHNKPLSLHFRSLQECLPLGPFLVWTGHADTMADPSTA